MTKRLHWQIFGALLVTGLSCVALAMLLMSLWGGGRDGAAERARDVAALIIDDLPAPDEPRFQRQLRRRARRLHVAVSVWDARGRLLAQAGRPLRPPRGQPPRRPEYDRRDGSVWLALDEGHSVAVALRHRRPPPQPFRLAAGAVTLFLALLLGSYFAARRITQRLTLLERGVMRFGRGELDARVDVRGQDEIARLASAFNRSFERISGLLRQQRHMLQSASHELRSPLSRVRMALELVSEPELDSDARARIAAGAERDIAELDQLIGDLLLAGRLSDTELPQSFVRVPLADIVREEAERVGAELTAVEPLQLPGDPRMLRSLIRNLLENARRYGADPIRLRLHTDAGHALLQVEDEGSGIADADQARIFEPFYRPQGHSEGRDGGVGLGLWLVRSITTHHGGTARYLRRGTTSCFEVRLPLASAEGSSERGNRAGSV